MATFRHTLEFLDVNGSTWREIYYSTGASISGELQTALSLYQARIALLATPHTLLRDRVSNMDVVRNTGRRVFNLVGLAAPTIVQNAPDIAPQNAALVVNLVGAAGGSRYLWMRGCTGEAYSQDAQGRPNPGNKFRTALGVFLTQLAEAKWGIRQLVSSATNKPQKVSKVDGATQPGQAILTMSAPLGGILAGGRIILGGFDPKVFPALKGQFSVIKVGADTAGNQTLQIPYATPANATLTPTAGTARIAGYNAVSVVDPVNSQFAYAGSRITKSPQSNSRGARRAARIRELA